MFNPIVHFEIIGKNPSALRAFYKELFGWDADTAAQVAPEVSEEGNYGFITPPADMAPQAVPGGIGGGREFKSHAIFYVGVQNVAEALAKAEALGAVKVMGPVTRPDGGVTVAHFTDPEGNLIGLAGPQ